MSLPVDRQPLIAAFTLGIAFQAGAGAFFLYIGGRSKKIFRDGLRLALITFIASAALWSQITFAATLIEPTTPTGCQIAVIFASFFDQIARFALEQYLIWAINSGLKKAPDTFVPQAILIVRLVIGGIFVGFQRPQLSPVCQTSTDMTAVGIAVIASDAVMVSIFVARASMIGLIQDIREKRPGVQRSKAVIYLIAGLALWTAASVPMFLGISSIDMLLRTALPAGALTLVLGLISAFMGVLVMSRARASVLPENPSPPPDMRTPRNVPVRDISSAESNYPPGRFEDLKADEAGDVVAYPSGRQVIVAERSVDDAAAYPAAVYGSSAAGASIGVAVGRPSVDGMGSASASAQYSRQKEEHWSNLKAQPKQKSSFFTRGGPASSITVGKLAISNPILQSERENPALNKIATVDLATAARMDKDRRDLNTLHDAQSLIAQRAAPLPPALTREEAMRRTQSTKRKQIGTSSAELLTPPDRTEIDGTQAMLGEAAVSTSLQTSPGTQSLRKRSPRSPPRGFTPGSPSFTFPKPPVTGDVSRDGAPVAAATSLPSRPLTIATLRAPPPQTRPQAPSAQDMEHVGRPTLPPTWPKQEVVNDGIRPSRASPDAGQQIRTSNETHTQTASQTSPEPALQRRGTVGLPSNPRSRGVKTPGKEGAPQPTIMFVNQIEYNDPAAVQTIIQDATGPKTAPALRESVLHRPRPIPRQHEKDRQIFPAEQSPVGHRRTRSGGSIASRLRDQPASPPNLPPLPPAPKSAGFSTRPLPNDTRSMTFDEKMDLFFPAPKSAAASVPSRGSIPEMPALPSLYLLDRNNSAEGKATRENFLRSPTRTSNSTKSSVRTQSILEISNSPTRPTMPNLSKFSVDTYIVPDRHGDDEGGTSWIPGILPKLRVRSEQSNEGAKRRSSPILPLSNGSMSEYGDSKTRADEETVTNWGSVHSPVIMEARQVQVPVPTLNPAMYNSSDDQRTRDLSVLDPEGGKELMTIMLDPSVERERLRTVLPARTSQAYGHHRLGDECATFSTRRERVVSRRMPPPTPLLLNVTSKNSFVITAAEPSPLEPPEKALQVIQDQLRKLDEPDGSSSDDRDQRLRLLDSLEQEMGQQENQWHEMQIGIQRDSLATVDTSSRRVSHENSTTSDMVVNLQSSTATDTLRRESRRSTHLQAPEKLSLDDLSAELELSPSRRSRSLWKRKFAAAELEFLESTSDYSALMPARDSLQVVIPFAQLGSPTPPDTDSDNEEILRAREVLRRHNAPVAKLWKPSSPLTVPPARSLLWTAPSRLKPVAPEDIPGIFVRPAVRKMSAPLHIATSQLWTAQTTFVAPARFASIGLWRGAPIPEPLVAQAPKPNPRPLTQRPPRRMKRVSTLPDIVENPEPLPNKRGTLGIFQFPWGEKSDTAIAQARSSNLIMAMPGTMSTGGSMIRAALEARSKQLEIDDYSSSFFDDYEEEEDDDYISEINGDDSDDEFDETTLWEIASLLKTDQVPSKHSLLPQRRDRDMSDITHGESMFEASDYELSDDTEEERPVLGRQDSDPLSIEVREDLSTSSVSVSPISLWTSEKHTAPHPPPTVGLPQPDERTWAAYIPAADIPLRSKPHQFEAEALESSALWVPRFVTQSIPESVSATVPATVPVTAPVPTPVTVSLWSARKDHALDSTVGLPTPDGQFWAVYTSMAQDRPRARPRQLEEPAPLESASLWVYSAAPDQVTAKQMWAASRPQKPLLQEKETQKPKTANAPSMWTARPSTVHTEPQGLYDPSHRRTSYRTSAAEPAALDVVRKPRTAAEPLPKLPDSSNLWTSRQKVAAHDPETFWMTTSGRVLQQPSELPQVVAEVSPAPTASLWIHVKKTPTAEHLGLFSVQQDRSSYRTTSAEPAALQTVRRPRVSTEALAQLAPQQLWTANRVISYDYDWISIASVGPQSPSYASSSGRSSPLSESSSVRTNSTMASSMAPSITHATRNSGFPGPRFPTWWEPNEKPSRLSMLPEGPEETRIPESPHPSSPSEDRVRSVPAADPVNLQHVLIPDTDSDDVVRGPRTSGRFQHRKTTPEDWAHALELAIAAGRTVRAVRTAASPADWARALAEAITLSSRPSTAPTLWLKHVDPLPTTSSSLWTPSIPSTRPPSSPLPTIQDDESSRLRRRRVKAMIPRTRKAELRAQIAAIEAGVDPSIVGLVNFRGQALWQPDNGHLHHGPPMLGHGRDWIQSKAPIRASQAVFRFWLPGSGEEN